MKEVTIGTHKVVMYDSIEDLPILRYHRFNKFMLIDAGIGSDLSEIDVRLQKAMAFIKAKDVKSTVTELMNLRQTIFLLQNEVTPKHLAFAALVVSIDGKECNDISEDGLTRTMSLLNDAPEKEVGEQTYGIKKKLETEMALYAPNLFDNSISKEYYQKLKQRTILFCNALIEGREPDEDPEIEKIDTELLLSNKPMSFEGSESTEIKQDKDFEYACLTIAQHLNVNAKQFTVLEYYNALSYIQDLAKEQKKQSQKSKLKKR